MYILSKCFKCDVFSLGNSYTNIWQANNKPNNDITMVYSEFTGTFGVVIKT